MDNPLEASFFDGRLKLLNDKCLTLQKDVLVVPCYPDILSGGELYKEVMDNVGEEIKESIAPFSIYDPGSCKLTFSGNLKQFKRLALCILPEMFSDEGLSFLDRLKVALAIADSLDLSTEMSAQSIVFSHWNIASVEQAAEILLLCIAKWIRSSVYTDRIKEIIIALEDEHIFDIYFNLAQLIEGDPSLVLDVLQTMPEEEQFEEAAERELTEQYPLDLTDSSHLNLHPVQVKQERRQLSAPFLFYSRNLSSSILSIEQTDGSLRQYRLSTTIMEKNTHYFRCSRCDHLNKSRPDLGIFRPKITIKDGDIASDRFPMHHPMCEEVSKSLFVVQQLDRIWKTVAPYENAELRSAYTTLRDIASADAENLYREMDTPAGRFPEWEILKAQAQKMHSQFSLRLIKCNPDNGNEMNPQLNAIRQVEGELDGEKAPGNVAWLSETGEEEPAPIVKVEEDDELTEVSRGIHRRKPPMRYKTVHDPNAQYKFRIVRPRTENETPNAYLQALAKRSQGL
ncbi:unnamed protein product [Bursaphelenchus okinawaensis]|uniref:RYYR-CCHC domain-containing protein n=1 Tax=Bursaphelenchus okinawaensis TaxID=465554 RepID=A0A811LSC0_9BILA|nr:unnamed protein product [Bursaphelenchus okinawaensis]CAG9127215.1 unnamed protein product [Bursaphelenchus okinawaensis]